VVAASIINGWIGQKRWRQPSGRAYLVSPEQQSGIQPHGITKCNSTSQFTVSRPSTILGAMAHSEFPLGLKLAAAVANGAERAIVAIARKLAVLLLSMWRR